MFQKKTIMSSTTLIDALIALPYTDIIRLVKERRITENVYKVLRLARKDLPPIYEIIGLKIIHPFGKPVFLPRPYIRYMKLSEFFRLILGRTWKHLSNSNEEEIVDFVRYKYPNMTIDGIRIFMDQTRLAGYAGNEAWLPMEVPIDGENGEEFFFDVDVEDDFDDVLLDNELDMLATNPLNVYIDENALDPIIVSI